MLSENAYMAKQLDGNDKVRKARIVRAVRRRLERYGRKNSRPSDHPSCSCRMAYVKKKEVQHTLPTSNSGVISVFLFYDRKSYIRRIPELSECFSFTDCSPTSELWKCFSFTIGHRTCVEFRSQKLYDFCTVGNFCIIQTHSFVRNRTEISGVIRVIFFSVGNPTLVEFRRYQSVFLFSVTFNQIQKITRGNVTRIDYLIYYRRLQYFK